MIVALAALLRFFSLSSLGFWTDEFCSLSCADSWGLQFDKPPLNKIIPADRPNSPPAVAPMTRLASARGLKHLIPAMATDEAHPPLYFILLRIWEIAFGDSERAVRSPDVIFSLLAILLLFFTARDSIGAATALWACLLMAVAQPQIQFAQEARNYMPVVSFSLLAVLSIQRLRRNPSAGAATLLDASLLGASLLAMMLTHYFAAGAAGAIAVYAILNLRGRARRLAITSIAIAALSFLLLWGPFLLRQHANIGLNYTWTADASPGHLLRTGARLLNLPWRLVAELPAAAPMRLLAGACGLAFYLMILIACIRRPALRLWGLWFFTAVGLVAAVDLWRSTAQLALLRYTLFATPAEYVLLAAAIQRGRFRYALPAIAVLAGLLSLKNAYAPPWKTDFKTPVEVIARHFQPGDGLVIIGSDPIADGVLFAAFRHYIMLMPTTAVLTGAPDDATLKTLRECPHIYILWRWPDRPFPLPGFVMDNPPESIPYFAEVETGRFDGSTHAKTTTK
jgi:uncharacterized membrane protein